MPVRTPPQTRPARASSPANLLLSQYKVSGIIGYALFGLGLAFYATPSTDAALSSLPEEQAGSGAGIYKMASSLGSAFGVAISAAIFTALSGDASAVSWLQGIFEFAGRTDNIAVREAGMIALYFNFAMAMIAIIAIMLTVPKAEREERSGKAAKKGASKAQAA